MNFPIWRQSKKKTKKNTPVRNVGYKCPHCRELFDTRALLGRHGLNQHGRGTDLQPVPWGDEDAPWEVDPANSSRVKTEYNTNRAHILRQHIDEGGLTAQYNFPGTSVTGSMS